MPLVTESRSGAANDSVITSIQSGLLTHQNISLDQIRSIARCDRGLDLRFGTAIPGSVEELDQYLHTYGLMTQRQWDEWVPTAAFERPIVAAGMLHIVDHGCGQGTSLAAFLDRIKRQYRSQMAAITLIEPSKPALDRAGDIAKCYCPNASITRINKRFDELTAEDIRPRTPIDANIHLLSQVLDIGGYDQFALLTKVLRSTGEHHFVALSADRGFHGGTQRIEALDKALKEPRLREWIEFLDEPRIERYSTTNTSGKLEARVRWTLSVRARPGIPDIVPPTGTLMDAIRSK